MKTNELRIGNIVDHHGNFLFIGCLDDTSETVKVNTVFGGWSELNISEISGIPISEEILLKFGFKSISDIHPTFRLSRFIVEENVMKDGYTFRIAINNQESVHIIKIKYFHQLQNLYFALKGTDLDTSKIL